MRYQAPLDMDLQVFLDKAAACNTGVAGKAGMARFAVAGEAVGYLRPEFAAQLAAFTDVFEATRGEGGTLSYVSVRADLATPEQRTQALARCMATLRERGVLTGWRDELYPVTRSFHGQPLCSVERCAAAHLGIKSYGVHINGYVELPDGSLALWVGRRSATKATWPGKLDHIAAGGQPVGISCRDNVVKECMEEASIPAELAQRAVPTSVVACEQMQAGGVKRDVLFCFDLLLPAGFAPTPLDGEVQEFVLMPLAEVATLMAAEPDAFKPNVELVVIDFLVRRGLLTPDMPGYLELLAVLRSGDVC